MKKTLYIFPIIATILCYGCDEKDGRVVIDSGLLLPAQPIKSVEGYVKNTNNDPLEGIKINIFYQDDTDIDNLSEEDINRFLTDLNPVFYETEKEPLCTDTDGYYYISHISGLKNTKQPIFVIATDTSNVYCSAIVATDIIYENSGVGKGTVDFILERRQ